MSNFSFPTVFYIPFGELSAISSNLKLSSANFFYLNLSELKAFAGIKIRGSDKTPLGQKPHGQNPLGQNSHDINVLYNKHFSIIFV